MGLHTSLGHVWPCFCSCTWPSALSVILSKSWMLCVAQGPVTLKINEQICCPFTIFKNKPTLSESGGDVSYVVKMLGWYELRGEPNHLHTGTSEQQNWVVPSSVFRRFSGHAGGVTALLGGLEHVSGGSFKREERTHKLHLLCCSAFFPQCLYSGPTFVWWLDEKQPTRQKEREKKRNTKLHSSLLVSVAILTGQPESYGRKFEFIAFLFCRLLCAHVTVAFRLCLTCVCSSPFFSLHFFLVCLFVCMCGLCFQRFEPFRGDKNMPASLEPSCSVPEEVSTNLRFVVPPVIIAWSYSLSHYHYCIGHKHLSIPSLRLFLAFLGNF